MLADDGASLHCAIALAPRLQKLAAARLHGLLDTYELTSSANSSEAAPDAITRTAGWPFRAPRRHAALRIEQRPATPHPAVARIIVPEGGATAYGSGTLVDVRDQYGLVVTNWHVVRDSRRQSSKWCFPTASARTPGRSRSTRTGTSRRW